MTTLSPRASRYWLASLGSFALLVFFLIELLTNWTWSVMMDDISYLQWMPHVTNIYHTMLDQINIYLQAGRFYPVKYLANLLKWRYLPLDPTLFHWVNYLVLMTILTGTAFFIVRRRPIAGSTYWGLFIVGIGVSQRPLLDVVALNTIAEPWVILFTMIGFALFEKHPIAYRLCFLFAGLSKEPAISLWAASALTYGLIAWNQRTKPIFKRSVGNALLDTMVFVTGALAFKYVQSRGSYMPNYALFGLENSKLFLEGLAKSAFGIPPIALLIFFAWKDQKSMLWADLREDPLFLLAGSFGLGYLFLTVSKGIAGYLLIPTTFALYVLAGLSVARWGPFIYWTTFRLACLSIVFLFCLTLSLGRYWTYSHAINESTRALTGFIQTSEPCLILLNGDEAATQGRMIASQLRSPAQVRSLTEPQASSALQTYHGKIVLFEFTSFFGSFPEPVLNRILSLCGHWDQVDTYRSYKVFVGHTIIAS